MDDKEIKAFVDQLIPGEWKAKLNRTRLIAAVKELDKTGVDTEIIKSTVEAIVAVVRDEYGD